MQRDVEERLLAEIREISRLRVKWGWPLGLVAFVLLWIAFSDAWPAALLVLCGAAAEGLNRLASRLMGSAVASSLLTFGSGAALGTAAWISTASYSRAQLIATCVLVVWAFGLVVANAPFRRAMYAWSLGFLATALLGVAVRFHEPTLAIALVSLVIAAGLLEGELAHRLRLAAAARSARFRHAGSIDELTGLMNRRALFERLEHNRAAGMGGVFSFIDLDNFKAVNDAHGHQGGDLMLRAIAARLRENLPASTIVARIGGDEFVVDCSESATAAEAGELLLSVFEQRFDVDGASHQLSVSIGSLLVPEGSRIGADDLLGKIDQAMYQAKHLGGGRYVVGTL